MWRVIARRAASIWRAVIRSGSIVLRPYEPKLSVVPPFASPWMRPLNALRNLVFFGCSMLSRSEEHTSELQSLMRISYAVFCLKKKKDKHTQNLHNTINCMHKQHIQNNV